MNVEIEIRGIESLRELIIRVQRNIDPITARAINDVAFRNVMPDVRQEMREVFKNPTPFVLRAFRVTQKATPNKLEARLGYVDVFRSKRIRSDIGDTLNLAEAVVAPHIEGGSRAVKESELRLRRVGIMRPNEYLIPGPGAHLDRYGNPTRGEWTKLVSFYRGFNEGGYSANRRPGEETSRSGTRFEIMYFRRARGIMDMSEPGRSRLAWVIVGKRPQYRRRLKFEEVVQKSFDKNFAAHFDRRLSKVIR